MGAIDLVSQSGRVGPVAMGRGFSLSFNLIFRYLGVFATGARGVGEIGKVNAEGVAIGGSEVAPVWKARDAEVTLAVRLSVGVAEQGGLNLFASPTA